MYTERKQAFDIKSLIGISDEKSKRLQEDKIKDHSANGNKGFVKFRSPDPKMFQDFSKASLYHQSCCYGEHHGRLRDTGLDTEKERRFDSTLIRPPAAIPPCHPIQPYPVFPGSCCYVNHKDPNEGCISDTNSGSTVSKSCHRLIPHVGPHEINSLYLLQPGMINAFPLPYSRHDPLSAQNNRRIRTTFTPSQLNILERRFKSSHYIVGDERKQLAAELRLNESQVKIWFQNRRTKYKQEKEFDEMGGNKPPKRKGEHHVRKWQIDTHLMNSKAIERVPDEAKKELEE